MDIDLDLNVELLPQLIVISAACKLPDSEVIHIENFCCMAATAEELTSKVKCFVWGLEQAGYRDMKAVARIVPREVYASG